MASGGLSRGRVNCNAWRLGRDIRAVAVRICGAERGRIKEDAEMRRDCFTRIWRSDTVLVLVVS